MAWTAPAGSTFMARVAKIASSIIARVLRLICLTLPSADNQSRAEFCESTISTADTSWKQGSSEKRTNAKAEGTICDDHKGPDTSRSNAIHMRPPRQSRLSIG
ncbi:hypothetical protein CGGC5_v005895 [Colletotrichum fructicola Nara gc5]|uniref:Uncharacterized protein n=1 Tax=Colletotrichum fructicola (strain Nara gc5) TaxID=1213859 RepID=A0A7J6J9D6_COLFN|nr:hypothetical protein CGGC5_v005895 [Colletotrichum fructicola Nara gc5]